MCDRYLPGAAGVRWIDEEIRDDYPVSQGCGIRIAVWVADAFEWSVAESGRTERFPLGAGEAPAIRLKVDGVISLDEGDDRESLTGVDLVAVNVDGPEGVHRWVKRILGIRAAVDACGVDETVCISLEVRLVVQGETREDRLLPVHSELRDWRSDADGLVQAKDLTNGAYAGRGRWVRGVCRCDGGRLCWCVRTG